MGIEKAHQGGKTRGTRSPHTVLVVEDEESLRELVAEVLADQGFHILQAADAPGAIEIVKGHDGPIHLLLTDVVLPGKSGRALASLLLLARPDTKVLFMSGYRGDFVVDHGVLDTGADFIEKPFSTVELAARVRRALA